MDDLSPRKLALVGLLGLLPVIGYAALVPDPITAVAAVNVVLIVSSLYVALSPNEGHGNGHAA